VTDYIGDNLRDPADTERITGLAFVHGYHVTFFWGGMLFVLALLISAFFINARKEDVPTDPMAV
jgi:hypothetical protein